MLIRRRWRWRVVCVALVSAMLCGAHVTGQDRDATAVAGYDQILDTRVRDGFVYYRTLKADRAPLDRYVASLADAVLPDGRAEQIAFWLNAYNAIVLQTVIDHYPIAMRSGGAPRSIRQIAGAFEHTHKVAGRAISLDRIEQSILSAFHDPRVFLALGRGAAGGGRLRGEVYAGERLERQLDEQAAECVTRDRCVYINRALKAVQVNSIFSWRSAEFVEAYARQSGNVFAKRPPIERAVIGFIYPRVGPPEREFLARNQFAVQYLPFDWSLNDLATRKR